MSFLRLLVPIALILSAACSSPPKKEQKYDNAPAPAAAAPAAPAGCQSDDQCSNLGACGRCVNAACVKDTSCCETDGDCASGGRCRAGKCK